MAELSPGAIVRIIPPVPQVVSIASPGMVHSFLLMQGPPGEQGEPGPEGPTGPQGEDGDMVGPASAVDGNFPAFNGTSGSTLEDSGYAPDSFAGSTGGGREKTAALSATTGTATGDLATASVFTVTPSGNITLAFSNVPATGTACTVSVRVSQGATPRTVTMPANTTWMTTEPTQAANKRCWFTLITLDGGSTWDATAAVQP